MTLSYLARAARARIGASARQAECGL